MSINSGFLNALVVLLRSVAQVVKADMVVESSVLILHYTSLPRIIQQKIKQVRSFWIDLERPLS